MSFSALFWLHPGVTLNVGSCLSSITCQGYLSQQGRPTKWVSTLTRHSAPMQTDGKSLPQRPHCFFRHLPGSSELLLLNYKGLLCSNTQCPYGPRRTEALYGGIHSSSTTSNKRDPKRTL